MPIEAHCEYTLPQLAKIGGVKQADLERAIKRRELAAVKGPGGRGGKFRVLGENFIAWQRARHGQAQHTPRRMTTAEEAAAQVRAIFRGEHREEHREE
ncbi:MAG: hypothetical protein RBU21_07410 [FCB group bacterium]|jgi:hypothetical protein|nr:hypothetical protein [FCB group bacterium]